LRTTRFDFSRRRQSSNQSEPILDNLVTPYADYLRGVLPRGWSADVPHIRLIAEHLDAVTRGEVDRLAVFMPPRHAKSETITVRYPVYRLERDPRLQCLVTGYNERFARRFGRKTRQIAQPRIGLAADKAAADEWATEAGGLLMTRGVGSPPTGVGFGLIVIDDPIRRREDAESAVFREKCWDWYTDDLYTRLEPGGAIVLVMTHWHVDDVGARAIASEPGRWTVLSLPALAEDADALGRAPGDALWPERFDVTALTRIRDVMAANEGLRGWEALYQQRPSPREGDFFKVTRLAVEAAAPADLRKVRAWDMAATAGDGDWTVGVLMGSDGKGRYWVLDVVRGQWSSDERDRVIRQTAMTDGRTVMQVGPQDPGSAGVDAARAFVRLLAGVPCKTVRVTGDKQLRADPLSSQVNAGNVSLVDGPWVRPYIEELRTFPAGRSDDQVDASADAFREMTQRRVVGVY
jgi:predicted phage terminase large subunit-like protein